MAAVPLFVVKMKERRCLSVVLVRPSLLHIIIVNELQEGGRDAPCPISPMSSSMHLRSMLLSAMSRSMMNSVPSDEVRRICECADMVVCLVPCCSCCVVGWLLRARMSSVGLGESDERKE